MVDVISPSSDKFFDSMSWNSLRHSFNIPKRKAFLMITITCCCKFLHLLSFLMRHQNKNCIKSSDVIYYLELSNCDGRNALPVRQNRKLFSEYWPDWWWRWQQLKTAVNFDGFKIMWSYTTQEVNFEIKSLFKPV